MVGKIIPEVGFQLGRNEHLEINNRGWSLLCNPPRKVVESLVREFYANDVPQPGQHYGYISYVRGKSIDYSPSSIERMLMDGISNQLRRRDLSPQARGSLIPTSNTSEVTKERAVLIYIIMKGENVNVGEMIANNINKC
ncbi:hypothetical protein Ahy_B09g097531 [Arachis hypogaea]|uniref:Putative plant transposon protein domain-containing protein n=1 Tax=Arachis hypogaea TaxID=3818 RepID=A0A444XPB6_ARAHY|nr:hypothetical protein Ahy_B09g097531 [Arachis hypogaea]